MVLIRPKSSTAPFRAPNWPEPFSYPSRLGWQTRTNWHSHVLGQTLHVVAGAALIGTRDGTIIETHPGETVACPPDEEHWHGATADQFMLHLALWEGDGTDVPETQWLEPVTDERYNGPRTNQR
jgi:hypothetical protein